MVTILVTGGCGFIGSHFVRQLLLRPADVRVVNVDKLTYAGNVENLADVQPSERYRFVQADIADREAMADVFRTVQPWAVLNFAAESHVDRSILEPSPFFSTNVLGVLTLLEAARAFGIARFVQISTDEVYGDCAGKDPPSEDAPLLPSSPYAASKAAADLLCMAYFRTYGLPILIVRSSNNFGPFQFPEKLIPLAIRKALGGEPIPMYGDGHQLRDWLFVEDACDGILRVLELEHPGQAYNIGTGEVRENLEVVRLVCRFLGDELGRDPEVFLGQITMTADRPGHDTCYRLDTRKARRELEWVPTTRFEEGLRRTVRWYLGHQEWIRGVLGQHQLDYATLYEHFPARPDHE